MHVLVTGSSGLIGSALVPALAQSGHTVVRMLREGHYRGTGYLEWDPTGGSIEDLAGKGIDAVVNLAGAPLGESRWTDDRKREIRDSRVAGTTLLAETIAALDPPPKVLISGSAVGYYGADRGDELLTEESSPGDDFLARVCVDWERATEPAVAAGIRVAIIRTGIVLSTKGGALERMLLPFRAGLGGRFGSGEQYWSWITLRDQVGAILHLLERPDTVGPFNLAAPHPATNAEITKALGAALNRPTFIPTPIFAVKMLEGAELVDAMVLASQRASSAKLAASGYEFSHPHLTEAIEAALAEKAL